MFFTFSDSCFQIILIFQSQSDGLSASGGSSGSGKPSPNRNSPGRTKPSAIGIAHLGNNLTDSFNNNKVDNMGSVRMPNQASAYGSYGGPPSFGGGGMGRPYNQGGANWAGPNMGMGGGGAGPHDAQSTTNLYIRGLQPSTTDKDLQQLCQAYGKIVSTKAIIDQTTSQCKGYGFVDFESHDDAQRAMKELVKSGVQAQFARAQEQDPTNLYVANLPNFYNEQNLNEMFAPYGNVISTRILRDQRGISRSVGFARLDSREVCDQIINAYNGKPVPGCKDVLLVKFADSGLKKRNRQMQQASQMNGGGGGGYRDGGGYGGGMPGDQYGGGMQNGGMGGGMMPNMMQRYNMSGMTSSPTQQGNNSSTNGYGSQSGMNPAHQWYQQQQAAQYNQQMAAMPMMMAMQGNSSLDPSFLLQMQQLALNNPQHQQPQISTSVAGAVASMGLSSSLNNSNALGGGMGGLSSMGGGMLGSGLGGAPSSSANGLGENYDFVNAAAVHQASAGGQ